MLIRPENRWLYPIDWKELSDTIRFGRAGGRCEGCGRPHGRLICHLGDGRWWDDEALAWRNGRGRQLKLAPLASLPAGTAILTTQVVLACAHLDHDPSNNDPKNLKALCQRRHINPNREEHLHWRWFTYRLRKALGDLSLGPYKFRRCVSAPAEVRPGPVPNGPPPPPRACRDPPRLPASCPRKGASLKNEFLQQFSTPMLLESPC